MLKLKFIIIFVVISFGLLQGCQLNQWLKPAFNNASKETPKPPTSQPGKLTLTTQQTLFLIGQDIETVREFHQGIPLPLAGVSAYVSADGTGAFKRFQQPHGDLDLPAYLSEFPNSALSLGLWMVGQEQRIARQEPNAIQPLIKLLNILKNSQRPVFLRIGYEVDSFWNQYDPKTFIKAWRFIAQWIKDNNANNIATVWQISAYCSFSGYATNTYKSLNYDTWWPGDEFVDWVAFSYFSQPRDCKNYQNKGGLAATYGSLNDVDTNGNSLALEHVMNYLKTKNKPIMIAESTPAYYHLSDLTYKKTPLINLNDIVEKSAEDIWQEWYEPYFTFIEKHQRWIRAAAYINMPWDEYPAWHCKPGKKHSLESCQEGYWGNADIQANQTIKEKFLQRLQKPLYYFSREKKEIPNFHLFQDWQ